jgi:ABC-type uncharacterized transport system ATPase subunit
MERGSGTARRLEMRDITKCFPGVRANSGVCFDVEPGEVHALLGENGAGKSTLMRQLYGMYRPDSGEIILDGIPLRMRSPADAIRAGIGMIHQHFMLVQTLTVAQNVALGLHSPRWPFPDLEGVSERVRDLTEEYGLQVDPSAYVWQLSVGEQQRVEIIKALYRGAGILILDEPTAVLTPGEVEDLFSTLRALVAGGRSLVFISHKLGEVLAISDRVTVLRDGRVIGTRATKGATRAELVEMMVGREVAEVEGGASTAGEVALEIRGLRAHGDRGGEALRGVDLELRSGEILGLAGVSGNGQRELAECLAGMRAASAGSITVRGRDITSVPLDKRTAAGMAFIPEERMRDGAIREFSVQENVFLRDHVLPEYRKGPFLDFRAMRERAASLVRDYAVKAPSLETPVKNLSGGNIQKLILARELARRPTRGVDIGAALYIHERLLEQKRAGAAILLVSEDLDEVRALSDRVAVMYEGRIAGILPRAEASVARLGHMMAGVAPEGA